MSFQRASGEIRVSFFCRFFAPPRVCIAEKTRAREEISSSMRMDFDFPMQCLGREKIIYYFFLIDVHAADSYIKKAMRV